MFVTVNVETGLITSQIVYSSIQQAQERIINRNNLTQLNDTWFKHEPSGIVVQIKQLTDELFDFDEKTKKELGVHASDLFFGSVK